MNTNTPTLDQLKRGLEIAQRIAALEAEMAAIFAGKIVTPSAVRFSVVAAPAKKAQAGKKGRRKFSAQALANIRAAQKRRWAKVNGKKSSAAPAKAKAAPVKAATKKAPPTKKRKLAPEVRAKLAAAMKARWDAAKKSGAPSPTAKKK